MNIWCISKYACPPKYGVAARIFYLAKEFVKAGHSVKLIASDSNHLADYPATSKDYNSEYIDGMDFVWIKNLKYQKTASVKRILSWFDFELSLFRMKLSDYEKPDVVIISSLSLLSIFYGYLLKKKYSAKLIFEVRDIWPLTLVEEGGFSRWHPVCLFLAWVEKFAYKRADLIVGTMPRLDLHVKNIIGFEKPCFCSPLGIDAEVMAAREKNDDATLDQYFLQGKTIIGYAGSMGLANNLDTYIECIKGFKDHPNIHFVLVGAGASRDSYQQQLAGQKNVTFISKIPAASVPSFLARCDLLYLSTHNSEVWKYGQSMNKVVEYMYSGKPILASYSGYPSMIDEANCGEFIAPNNVEKLSVAIDKFITMDVSERSEYGLRGRHWIKEYRTYSVLAAAYLYKLKGN